MLFRALGGACGVCGALSTSSIVFIEAERRRGGIVGGSGVATDSLGVETAEAAAVFEFSLRPNGTSSGLIAILITFGVGCVPRGAMFCTTPCRWIPASAKLGRGVGRGGSTQLSNIVLGLCEPSAIVDCPSAAAFEDAGINGLAIRDLVGLGVGVAIVAAAAAATTSLSLRPRVLQPGSANLASR